MKTLLIFYRSQVITKYVLDERPVSDFKLTPMQKQPVSLLTGIAGVIADYHHWVVN